MSVQLVVFIPPESDVPSASGWSKVAAEHGFQLSMEPFDALRHAGVLPVQCEGIDAGFEYYNDAIDDYLEEVEDEFPSEELPRLRKFGRAVSLATHSRTDDLLASCVAAATLAAAVGGVLLDTQSGEFMKAKEALRWAGEQRRALTPRNAGERGAIAAATRGFVASALSALGFVPLDAGLGDHRRDTRWFHRPVAKGFQQFIQESVFFDGEEAFLAITFFASPRSLKVLRAKGLAGNVIGTNLFDYLTNELNRRVKGILPKNIPVSADFPATPAAKKLLAELRDADAGVWKSLSQSW